MAALPKIPDFNELEVRVEEFWRQENIYQFNGGSQKPIYSIDSPPPTISGSLHIGHAMSYSHIDFMARHMRMRGYDVLFPMGFDDNGLPTERYVEAQRGINIKDVGRGKFVKTCLEETEKARERYREVWERLGFSIDWDHSYSTIDSRCQRIAQRSFIELYEAGIMERRNEPSIWCPSCETTVAEAEQDDLTRLTKLFYFPFVTDRGNLTIATTRPELLGACVALFVHPEDERYKNFIGSKARVPIFDYDVDILPSTKADPKFGSGAVMVCTFGDKDDVELWREHGLNLNQIIDGSGRSILPGYERLSLAELRQEMVSAIQQRGILQKQEDLSHTERVHERCGTNTEYIVKPQWVIRITDLKDTFQELGERINWYPAYMKQRYRQWVENLRWDWGISRQRFFGIPFPVWYDQEGRVIVADKLNLPVDPQEQLPKGYKREDLTPETDVMDTWMTSSLTPLINARWGEDTEGLSSLLPMSVRPQAHDIIRTWAFYTIAKSYFHGGNIPWDNIMISGHGLDSKGKKMSKSKGNVVLPLDVVTEYSADALRLWTSSNRLGADAAYNEEEVSDGRRFLIKLWNASRFSSMHLDGIVLEEEFKSDEIMDRWITDKANDLAQSTRKAFDQYNFAQARNDTLHFFRNMFCDNYLEAVKHRLYTEGQDHKKADAQQTLYRTLLNSLKFIAPFAPHMTEEIYQRMFLTDGAIKSIHQAPWPEYDPKNVDEEARRLGDEAVNLFSLVRGWKVSHGIGLGKEIDELSLTYPSDLDFARIKEIVERTTRVKNISAAQSPIVRIITP